MRDDLHRAASGLRALSELIQKCPAQHADRLSAYLVRLGRSLRDDSILVASVHELRERERVDEEHMEKRTQAVCGRLSTAFHEFAEALRSGCLDAEVRRAVSGVPLPGRTSEPKTIIAMLEHCWRGIELEFVVADAAPLQVTSPGVRYALTGWDSRFPAVAEALRKLTCLDEVLPEANLVGDLQRVLERLSVGRLVDRLIAFANRWDETLSRPGAAQRGFISDGIQHDVPAVVELVVAQIDSGVARRHAVHRLRVLFEQFECDELRASLLEAEKTGRSREAVLQRAMDRFFFHDGYFPVTHAGASGGYLDTLLLERAETSGVPPLLIELKQVVAFQGQATRGRVSAAIEEARGEVQRYRGHIATRPQWSGLIPVIVVVHTCREDLSDLEASDVVLIDLSDKTPSQKTPRRPHGRKRS